MRLVIVFAFLILGWSAFSRSSVTRNVTIQELLSSTSSGTYITSGTVVSLSDSGVVIRDNNGNEARVFGSASGLEPGASGSLKVSRQGDSLSIAGFTKESGKSESGELLGLRYDQASNKTYGNVKSLGWVQVNSNGIYSTQR